MEIHAHGDRQQTQGMETILIGILIKGQHRLHQRVQITITHLVC